MNILNSIRSTAEAVYFDTAKNILSSQLAEDQESRAIFQRDEDGKWSLIEVATPGNGYLSNGSDLKVIDVEGPPSQMCYISPLSDKTEFSVFGRKFHLDQSYREAFKEARDKLEEMGDDRSERNFRRNSSYMEP